jgi:PadR family transcriptional regulator, regulatory protein PadR
MPDRQTTAGQGSAPDPSSGVRASRSRRTSADAPPERAAEDGLGPGTDGPAEPIDEREPFPGWPPRDFLAPFVLLAVSLQRSHGYVIEDYLRALGLFGITMSTLYRTLRQMEKDGLLVSTWEPGPTGPARRVYTITDSGHLWLDSSASMLNAYRDTIDRFFGLYGAGLGASRDQPDEPKDDKETQP